MEKVETWWCWVAYVEAPDEDILLYSALVPNYACYKLNEDLDRGEFLNGVGKVIYFSKLVTNDYVDSIIEKVSQESLLDLSIIQPSCGKKFPITSYRSLIGSSFGQKSVPISSYYTTPNVGLWSDCLDELANILIFLKEELNLPFDRLCCLIQREDMPVPSCLILKRYTEFQAYLAL